jgi:hypothetical protein
MKKTIVMLLLAVASFGQQQQQPIQDLNQLVGKQVIVQRTGVLCQPGTFTMSFSYYGKQAKVISLKPSKLSNLDSSRMPRAFVDMHKGEATILVQFEDGTQLDTCYPVAPRDLSDHFELAPGETLQPVSQAMSDSPVVPASSTGAMPTALTPPATVLSDGPSHAKGHSDYIKGTYLGRSEVQDGTYTNAINCGSEPGSYTCAGAAGFNSLTEYHVKTDDGIWTLETHRQVTDSTMCHLAMTPAHFRREKPNLLDDMKPGGVLLFRVEYHRKIGGTETDVYIPRADNPSKEDKFVGSFVPNIAPPVAAKPADNVKALCDSGKLSPELQAQYCKSDTSK